MLTQRYRWLTFALVGTSLVSRLPGQATGVPVAGPGPGQGVSIGVDFGAGRIKRSAGDDVSRALAGTVRLGVGPLAALGVISRTEVDPASGPDRTATTAGVLADVAMIGGPLVPFRISWQAGYWRELGGGARPWRGSLGLGASVTIPTVVLSIRPWLAPRVEYRGEQPVTGSRLKPALSAGVDLGLLNGLGIRVGYDNRLGWDSATERAAGISLGISYQFR
ncbi:MAG: hypothetical protein FJ206_06235 [Gemmatimonadetes bacterium]|nr:hypothetical protein [Gemmatimonadota bacterium]